MRKTGRTLGGLFVDDRTTAAQSFVEELVVRRELADNFWCVASPAPWP